jgi:hypothetical protein
MIKVCPKCQKPVEDCLCQKFDIVEARRKRDHAMSIAEQGKTEWNRAAAWAVVCAALKNTEFTTDAVWAEGLPPPESGSKRALGPVMIRAAKAYIVERTDRTIETAKADCHAQPIRVWRSLIYKPEQIGLI